MFVVAVVFATATVTVTVIIQEYLLWPYTSRVPRLSAACNHDLFTFVACSMAKEEEAFRTFLKLGTLKPKKRKQSNGSFDRSIATKCLPL